MERGQRDRVWEEGRTAGCGREAVVAPTNQLICLCTFLPPECIVWVFTCLPHMQGEPEILQVLNSFSTDQARIEALTSDSSKKRTRETPIIGRT